MCRNNIHKNSIVSIEENTSITLFKNEYLRYDNSNTRGKKLHFFDNSTCSYGNCLIRSAHSKKIADAIVGFPCFKKIAGESAEISHLRFKSSVCSALSSLYDDLEDKYGREAIQEETFEFPQEFVDAFVPLYEIRLQEFEIFLTATLEKLKDLQSEIGFSKFIYTGTIEEIMQLLSVASFPLMQAAAFSIEDGELSMRSVVIDLHANRSEYRMLS